MRRLLLSLLVMLVLLAVLDRVLARGMDQLFRTSTADEDGDTFRRAIRSEAPILVCGSSRAVHHYMVDTLSFRLGTRAYNLGRGGAWGALYQYGAAGIVLAHRKPRVWIMEVESTTLYEPELLDRLACFLPYVSEEPAAREVVLLRSRYERVRLLSHAYRYNSMLLPLLAPRLGKKSAGRDGFRPLYGHYSPGPGAPPANAVAQERAEAAPAPDPQKAAYLERTIARLRGAGVGLLVVRSPHHLANDVERARDRREEARLRTWFGERGVTFVDYSPLNAPVFADTALYEDATHLNERGALVMTRMLADTLRAMGYASYQ